MSAWVNRTVLSGSSTAQNGTNSHTCTFTPATSGNLLVAVIAASVTSTTPTGWTLVASAVNNTGNYVFSKTASSGESSFSTTHNSSNYPLLGVVYEFPSACIVIGTGGSQTNQTDNGTGPIMTNLTGIYTRFSARSLGLNSTSTTNSSSWVAPTVMDYDAYDASGISTGIALTIAYDNDCTGKAFQPISSLSPSGARAPTTEDVSFAISTTDTIPNPLFIQGAEAYNGGTSSTTAIAGYTWNVTAGDLLVVALSYQSATATAAITDTFGNTYIQAGTSLTGTVSGISFTDAIFYAVANTSGTNNVTVTCSTSVTYIRLLVHEYANVDRLDSASGATGSTTVLNSGNVTTNFPTELLFGWGIDGSGGTTAGTGFTLRESSGTESTEDQVATSKGTYNATYNGDGASWICQIATFYSSAIVIPVQWFHF